MIHHLPLRVSTVLPYLHSLQGRLTDEYTHTVLSNTHDVHVYTVPSPLALAPPLSLSPSPPSHPLSLSLSLSLSLQVLVDSVAHYLREANHCIKAKMYKLKVHRTRTHTHKYTSIGQL